MIRFILAALLFSSFAYACPPMLTASVRVNELTIDDKSDDDFKIFSNTQFSEQFALKNSTDGCLYASVSRGDNAVESTGKKLYLFIGEATAGHKIKVQLNGYSPKGKLFEVRSLLSAEEEFPFTTNAGFYDASGPAKEYLGKAQLSIE